jgi:hypothetical protein
MSTELCSGSMRYQHLLLVLCRTECPNKALAFSLSKKESALGLGGLG